MKKLLSIFLLINCSTFGQQTIYFNNFENGCNWNILNSGNNQNHWVCGTQAGNGGYQGGTHAMYIADTSNTYNYINSIGVPETTIVWTTLNTLGVYGDIYWSIDIHANGDMNYDKMCLAYKKNNPTVFSGWYYSTPLQNIPGWYTLTMTFIAASMYFQNSYTYVGIMFTCNNSGIYPPSFAFDNFRFWTNQSPLSIDTTQAPTQQQHYTRDNPIEAIYNLKGQTVSDTTNGFFIVKRKYSTEKIIKQ